MSNLDVSVIIRAVDRASAPMKNMMRGMRDLEKASARFNQRMQKAMSLSIAGDAALQVSRKAIDIFKSPVKTAMDFEAQMAKVGAVSRATNSDMGRLTQTARKLGATTTFSASQAAQGMEFLGMAGFNTGEIIKTMPGLLNLAKAGTLGLGRASDIASDIMSGFGLKAEDMGRISDVLTATFTRSNTTLGMLGETMKFVAPVAKTAGLSIEETSAFAGILANSGIKASQAGTTLRAMLLRLGAPGNKAREILDGLGITLEDSDGNLRNVVDLMSEVAGATKDLGSAEKLNILKEVFGEEPAAGVSALLAKEGQAGIKSLLESVSNSGGEASKIAARMDATFAGRMAGFNSAVESFKITVGNALLPTLSSLVQSFTSMVRWVDSLSSEFPVLTKVVSAGILVIGGLAGVIGISLKVMSAFISGWGMVSMAFTKTIILAPKLATGLRLVGFASLNMGKKMVIGALTGVRAMSSGLITLATRGIPVALAGMRAMTIAMLTNPIGLIVAGIGIAATLLIKYWEPVKTFFLNIWSKVEPYWQGFADWAGGLWDWLSGKFTGFGEIIQKYVLGPLSTAMNAAGKVAGFFGIGAESAVPSPAKKAAQAVALGTALAVSPVAAQQTKPINTIPNTVIKEMKKTVNIQPGAIVLNLSFPKDADMSNPESMANEMANSLQNALDNVARRSFYDDDDLG